jgi:hypothetical protein
MTLPGAKSSRQNDNLISPWVHCIIVIEEENGSLGIIRLFTRLLIELFRVAIPSIKLFVQVILIIMKYRDAEL